MLLSPRRVGLLVALVVAAGGVPAQAQTTLRYKFKSGERINYEMEQRMSMQMNAMGRDVKMDTSQIFDMAWTIGTVDADGKAKMTQKIERIRFVMDAPPPLGRVEYNSRDNKELEGAFGQILGPMFKAMVDAEFTLTMDTQGRFSDVKVPEKLLEALKNSPAGAQLGEMFSEEGIKRMVGQGGLILPDEALSKGKTWNQKTEVKTSFATMKMDNICVYDGPTTRDSQQLEQVSFQPKIAMEPNKDAPVTIKQKSADAKGTALFDNAAGRLVETKMTQVMEMEIEAGGQNMTQKLEQIISMKLVNKPK